jgi:hypothetical protein
MKYGETKAEARYIVMDRLEPRMFLSVAPTPYVQNGILKVWGTPGDDTIVLRLNSYIWDVTVDGVTTAIPSSGVTGMHVHAGAGNDEINLQGEPIVATVFAGQGQDSVYGGTRQGEVIAGGGNDIITAFGVVHVGNGDDTITCGGGDAPASTATTVYAGGGNDTIYAGTFDQINPGGGNDTIIGPPSFENFPLGSGTLDG